MSIDSVRQWSPEGLDANRLECGFDDAKPPYKPAEALIEANRCLQCFDAPCVRGCPTAIDIPKFIAQISSGNLRGAAKTIFRQNMLGASCARVCPVEEMCAGACVYHAQGGQPIAIGRLQRYATDLALADERASGRRLFSPASANGKRVALVGAGPASLACAAHLALAGVSASLYERDDLPGGLNTSAIAPYKMRADSSLAEVEWLLGHGIELKTGMAIGKDIALPELLASHDAVFIGVGLGPARTLGLEGPGIWGATALIRAIKNEPGFQLPADVHRALVVGGGNTAIDIARELAMLTRIRHQLPAADADALALATKAGEGCGLGISEVTLAYRRGQADMSAYAHEWAGAQQCGVRLRTHLQPRRAVHRHQRLVGAVFHDAANGCEVELPCELLVVAAGQEPWAALVEAGVRLNADGTVWTQPHTRATSVAGVYAGGDCVNGGKEVVDAAADGRIAAQAMLAEWQAHG